MAPSLSAPGSSSYSSDTLHVGDGTWDSSRDDFLLPPLVGLNFATMRYNGMGNRFLSMVGYHKLILIHAVIAAIAFLLFVPLAILINRFHTRSPYWALRLHIWLQITTFLLVTVVVILGFFAVGLPRSLTNPHHGIGVAIYVLIFVQVIGGWLMHRKESGRRRIRIPLNVMLHQWLGRAVALLGIVQVPLGLTLYGSPKFLFTLYTLWCFALLVIYFILSYRHQGDLGDYDSRGSYLTESEVTERRRRRTGLAPLAAAGAAGAGLAALWNRRRSRDQPRTDLGPESEESYVSDEKYSDTSRPGIGRRIMEIGAIGGGIAALRTLFKRRHEDDYSDTDSYRPPLGGHQSMTDGSYSVVDAPARPVTPGRHPLAQPPMTASHGHGRNESIYSEEDSFLSASPSRRGRHTFRNTLAAAGGIAALRSIFKGRRQRQEDRRAAEMREHEIEQERIQRTHSQGQYTGDGFVPRRQRRHGSQTASSYSSFDASHSGASALGPVAGAGAGVAAATALRDRDRIRPVGTDPVISGSSGIPITDVPPPGPPSHVGATSHVGAPSHVAGESVHHGESSGSEVYTTASGHHSHRHRDEAAAALGGAALGAAAAEAAHHRHSGRYTSTEGESPSASLKVKMHNDGRHVTLRQLTEEERRRARRERSAASRRQRASSLSSTSGTEGTGVAGPSGGSGRWRRTEEMERRQAEEMKAQQAQQVPTQASSSLPAYTVPPPPGPDAPLAAHRPPNVPPHLHPATAMNYPPPPPIPETHAAPYPAPGTSSVTSPGETSDATASYANNRRRRRAERAQARLAREGRTAGGGSSVEFT